MSPSPKFLVILSFYHRSFCFLLVSYLFLKELPKGKQVVDFECNDTVVEGDIYIEFFDGKITEVTFPPSLTPTFFPPLSLPLYLLFLYFIYLQPMFRIFLHSGFLKDGPLVMHKRDLDGAADDVTCKHFSSDFKVVIKFKQLTVYYLRSLSLFSFFLSVSLLCPNVWYRRG